MLITHPISCDTAPAGSRCSSTQATASTSLLAGGGVDHPASWARVVGTMGDCASWCTDYNCDKTWDCGGCPACAASMKCDSWCNAYTCSDDQCQITKAEAELAGSAF